MRAWRSWWAPIATIGALLAAVYTLPPDTTMAQVRESGTLRVCVPESLPPLVTNDRGHPGIDVEILEAVADRADLRLQLVSNRAIGRDFDPRNWRVTRAQCLVIAGGVVATPATRAFLDTTTPHLETGWAAVAIDETARLAGGQVGVHVPVAGLDRLALSSFLREMSATVSIVQWADDLVLGLRDGTYDVAVTDALTARVVTASLGGGATAMWLPQRLERFPIAFGLWKGDLTLRRAIERELRVLEREGEIDRIVESYELAPLSDTCWVCGDPPGSSSDAPP